MRPSIGGSPEVRRVVPDAPVEEMSQGRRTPGGLAKGEVASDMAPFPKAEGVASVHVRG